MCLHTKLSYNNYVDKTMTLASYVFWKIGNCNVILVAFNYLLVLPQVSLLALLEIHHSGFVLH